MSLAVGGDSMSEVDCELNAVMNEEPQENVQIPEENG